MNTFDLLIKARKGLIDEPGVAAFMGFTDLAFLANAKAGKFAERDVERRLLSSRRKAEDRVAAELLDGLSLPESASRLAVKSFKRKLKGATDRRPIIARAFAQQFMPGLDMGRLFADIERAFKQDGKVVLPASYEGTPEIEMIRFFYGPTKVAVEVKTDAVTIEANTFGIPEDTFEMKPVSKEDFINLVILLGGHYNAELNEGRLRRVRIRLEDDAVSMDGKLTRRTAVVSSVVKAQVLDPFQAAFLIALTASEMSREDLGFRNAITSTMGGLFRHRDWAMTDGLQEHKRASEFQSGIFSVGRDGLTVSKTVARIEAIQKVLAAMPDTIVKGQAEVFFRAEDLVKILGDGTAALASTDPTKFVKRLLQDWCEQLDLTLGMDEGHVMYRGIAGKGRLVKMVCAPTGAAIMGGALGSILVTQPYDDVVDSRAFSVNPSKEISGMSLHTTREEVSDALPAVGEELEPGLLKVPGMPRPVRIKKSKAGTVVDVMISDGGSGTWFWTIVTTRENSSAEFKGRGFMKGVGTYVEKPLLLPIGVEPTHANIIDSDVVISGDSDTLVYLMGDAAKILGKNNARFRVEMAVNTIMNDKSQFFGFCQSGESIIRNCVPEHLLREVNGKLFVEYDELADVEGAYEKLVETYNRLYSYSGWQARKIQPIEFDKLVKGYGVDMANATAFNDPRYGAGCAIRIPVSGATFLGHSDEIMLIAYDSGKFAVAYKQALLTVYGYIKVESIGIEDSVTVVPSMLETAYSAHMMGLEHTARMIAQGGEKYAQSYLRLAQLFTMQEAIDDQTGLRRHNVLEAGRWLALEATGKKVIRISDQGDCVDERFVKTLTELYTEEDLDKWDQDVVIAVATQGKPMFGFDAKLLRTYASGTEEAGVLVNVRDLLASAAQGLASQVTNYANILHAQMFNLVDSEGVRKRIHSGATCVGAKRCAVITDDPEAHRKVYIRKNGKVARRLCRLFGCTMEELEGKMVLGYRAPMFLIVPMTIVFSKQVGPNLIGVVGLVASVDQGDFDGDPYYLIPVTCKLAYNELLSFDAIGYAEKIHAFANAATKPEHFIEGNLFDSSKTSYAKATIRKMTDIHTDMVKSAIHQTISLGKDGNRAHLAVVSSVLTYGLECQRFTPAMANGMMWFVFEPQLAGYASKWQSAHDMLDAGSGNNDHRREFLAYATETLELSADMANAWFDAFLGHRFYTKVSKLLGYESVYAVNDEGNYEVDNVVPLNPTEAEKSAAVINLIAGAIKHLAQGKMTLLLKAVDMLEVVYVHMVKDAEGELKKVPVLNEDGAPIRNLLIDSIEALADMGNPAAERLLFYIDNVLPIARYLEEVKARAAEDDEANFED